MATKSNRQSVSIRKATPDKQMTPDVIVDFRVLDTGNIVLVFESGAEVIMPGEWRVSRDLDTYADKWAAWWEDGQFYLLHEQDFEV